MSNDIYRHYQAQSQELRDFGNAIREVLRLDPLYEDERRQSRKGLAKARPTHHKDTVTYRFYQVHEDPDSTHGWKRAVMP